MKLTDVFNKAAQIKDFPSVEIETPVKQATSKIGKITTIKPYGIAVRFGGMKWDTWFWESEGTDKRSRYMHQLKLCEGDKKTTSDKQLEHDGMLGVVKLTKKALNEFIGWTTTRYNDYLGFGTKKQNVDTVYNSLKNGFYTDERGVQDLGRNIFTIECASPCGENANGKSKGRGASNKYWKTKQSGDEYTINCIEKTIVAKHSNRTIKFDC